MSEEVQLFTKKYKVYESDPIMHLQLQHRMALVQSFSIKEGMRVLEIGCGQGDTTVVLADAVGESGHVTAIDIASGNYGAPMTLAEAHAVIQQSPLGERITFQLETDFLQLVIEQPFDVIVLSHCSWYFRSKKQLAHYFARMYEVASKVYVAEWNLAFERIEQRSHFCAVSIIALYSAYVQNDGNIQHVWNREQIQTMAEEARFQLEKSLTVDASYLPDGKWEMGYANYVRPQFSKAPSMIQTLVHSYYDVMNEQKAQQSLNSFVLTFTR